MREQPPKYYSGSPQNNEWAQSGAKRTFERRKEPLVPDSRLSK